MDKLLNLATPREMLKSAKGFHDDINLIYNDVFQRIDTFPVAPHVRQLIQIVAFARKPLDTASLEHAIAVALGPDEIDPLDLPDAIDLVNKCLGLVMVDNHSIVRLSHETVGDFVRQQISQESTSGDAVMARICLSYLRHSIMRVVSPGPQCLQQLETRGREFPLLAYAAIHWGQHVRRATTHDNTVQAQSFLEDEVRIAIIAQIMWHDNLEHGSGWDAEDGVTGLHLAAYFGLNNVVSTLLARGENVNAVDCMGTTPLMYAVNSGHSEAVSILLHANADASLRCRRGRTVLHRACCNMDAAVIQQLVELPGDIAVNAIDKAACNETALHFIAQTDDVEILNMLLSRSDIDVNSASDGSNRITALHSAVLGWNVDTLRALLNDKRVDVNKTSSFLITALSAACSEDNYDAVALLLDHGADPYIADEHGGQPLLRAIDENSFNTVRLLIERNVDYHFVDLYRRGILHGCAVNNRPQILRYLLQTKTDLDPNAQGDRGETPLHDAVVNGYGRVVTNLLDFGARTDVRDNVGRTPLRAAREAGQTDILRMLVEARKKEQAATAATAETTPVTSDSPVRQGIAHADTLSFDEPFPIHAAVRCLNAAEFQAYIEAQGNDLGKVINQLDNDAKQTALQIAVTKGRNQAMSLLIKNGINLDIQDKWGWTALHLAASYGNLEAVKELVNHNASMNITDRQDRTALDCVLSSRQDDIEIAIFMIKHGGLANKREYGLAWVLRASVECNDLEIVKLVCAQGVPCHARIGGRLTPYQLAKKKGLTEIADFLLQESKRRQTVVPDPVTSPNADPSDDEAVFNVVNVPSLLEVEPVVDSLTETKPSLDVDADAGEKKLRRDGLVFSVFTQPGLTTREYCLITIILVLSAMAFLR